MHRQKFEFCIFNIIMLLLKYNYVLDECSNANSKALELRKKHFNKALLQLY